MEGNYPALRSNPRFQRKHETTEIRGVSRSQQGTITCFVERGDKTPANTNDEESLLRMTLSTFRVCFCVCVNRFRLVTRG